MYRKVIFNAQVYAELIETLWNVNQYTRAMLTILKDRINRNIVECKCNKH